MIEVNEQDRLTPNQARQIAKVMSDDQNKANDFIAATVSRLEQIIPSTGHIRADRIEDAFLLAAETHKIFNTAGLDVWNFFHGDPRHSLWEYVFVAALKGKPLRDIIESLRNRSLVSERGELLLDAGKFAERHLGPGLHLKAEPRSDTVRLTSIEKRALRKTRTKRRPWTEPDVASLKLHSRQKTPVVQIARTLKRSAGAIRKKALSLSLPIGARR